jgi:hypothetical protein
VPKTSQPDPAGTAAAEDAGLVRWRDTVHAAAVPEEPDAETPVWGNWRYTGPPGRVYPTVPVTPEPGDVLAHLGPPSGDGCWESTDAKPNRMPDNWRPDLSEDEHARLRGDVKTPEVRD